MQEGSQAQDDLRRIRGREDLYSRETRSHAVEGVMKVSWQTLDNRNRQCLHKAVSNEYSRPVLNIISEVHDGGRKNQ